MDILHSLCRINITISRFIDHTHLDIAREESPRRATAPAVAIVAATIRHLYSVQ